MAEVLVFHHALGLTEGIEAFASELSVAGHDVITPDLFDGRVFTSIDEGVAHADAIGFENIAAAGARHAEHLGDQLVVIGFSLGALPAQNVAQNRPGVAAAVLCHSAAPLSFFGGTWPAEVPIQMHMGTSDPFAAEDRDAIDQLVTEAHAELHEYDTAAHLVADVTSPDYDAAIAASISTRILELLKRLR